MIVDNGSTDATADVAAKIASNAPRTIRFITTERKGANRARNAGLHAAAGKYIQFLDCDDELVNDKLALAISKFSEDSRLVGVYSDGQIHFDQVERSVRVEACHENVTAIASGEFSEFTCGLNTNMPVWKTDYLRDNKLLWDEELDCWQETEFYFRVLLSLGNPSLIMHVPKIQFLRHRNANSISASRNSQAYLESQNCALDKIYGECLARGLGSEALSRQRASFKWELLKRSVVGGVPEMWEKIAPTVSRESRSTIRRMICSLPYSIVRTGYYFRRKLSGPRF